MNKDLALIVLNTAARSANELAELCPMMKEHWDAGRDDSVKLAIASAIYEVGVISDRIYEQHPDLQRDAKTRRNNYGRAY